MDDVAIRLKCLEIATSEHPGTRLMRAEELFKWVKSAPVAAGSESSGGPITSADAKFAEGVGFKLTEEQKKRLDAHTMTLDPDELKRMSES